jgi:hypothetical protein
MFLSDVSYLQKINKFRPSPYEANNKGSNVDQFEVELDRLYSTSPLITEWSSTYQLGELYKAESEVLALIYFRYSIFLCSFFVCRRDLRRSARLFEN